MSRLLIRMMFLLPLLIPVFAKGQSKAAYVNAGEVSLKKNDPQSATGFFIEALEYDADAAIMQKIGLCWRLRSNFQSSISWYRKSIAEGSPSTNELNNAQIQLYDLLKRIGEIEQGLSCIHLITEKNIQDSLRNDYSLYKLNQQYKASTQVLGGEVNSGASDVAPQLIRDSLLVFSSNRFKSPKSGQPSSRILASKFNSEKYITSQPFGPSSTLPSKHFSNPSISQDGRVMVFTESEYDEDYLLKSRLMESTFSGNKWSEPKPLNDSINFEGFSCTQPNIRTNREKGYVLYFSSNKPGGKGGMDIWKAERDASGRYSNLKNLDQLNSAADEWTPFYDAFTATLYFSSEKAGGFGGLDIWKFTDDSIINAGSPMNSGYDDLYPFIMEKTDSASIAPGYFVSNRPPSRTFKGESCCFDIFSIQPLKELTTYDSTALLTTTSPNTDRLVKGGVISDTARFVRSVESELKLMLPLRLYFDNDYPDPRSRKSETKANYGDLAAAYLAKEEQFVANASDDDRKSAISAFFRDSVSGNLNRLQSFSEWISEIIKIGYKVELTLQGSASPLADSRYNVILSQRRISSLLNEWQKPAYQGIANAIQNGQILITQDAAGESLGREELNSDAGIDPAAAVYGLSASQLRRIEIISIKLKKQ